jgi:hypothetical protein
MTLHADLTRKLKECAANILLTAAVGGAIASVAVGYSRIRESQVTQELKLKIVEAKVERVESKLDRIYGWTYEEGASSKP